VVPRIITYGTVEWAISSFSLRKNPGTDGIFPPLLQEVREIFIPYLIRILRARMATGYVPALWCQAKVVFNLRPVGFPTVDPGTSEPSVSHGSC
jgi:hypothetical protein